MLMSAHVHVQMIHTLYRPHTDGGHAMRCDAMRCHAMRCHVALSHALAHPMPRHHVMPCHVHAMRGPSPPDLRPFSKWKWNWSHAAAVAAAANSRRRQSSQASLTQLNSSQLMPASWRRPCQVHSSPTQLNSRLVGARLERGQHHGGGLGGAPRALHLALGVDELVEVDRA